MMEADPRQDDYMMEESPVTDSPSTTRGGAHVDSYSDTGEQAGGFTPGGVGGWQPLFGSEQRDQLSGQWSQIQTEFVDRPREAVQRADVLVVDVMQRVTSSLAQERQRLEGQWEQGDDVSTEDLRIALTRYRSFFDRLLSA